MNLSGSHPHRLTGGALLGLLLLFVPLKAQEETEILRPLEAAETAQLLGEMLAYAGALNDLRFTGDERQAVINGLSAAIRDGATPPEIREEFSTAYEAMQARFAEFGNNVETPVPFQGNIPGVVGYMAAEFSGIVGYPFSPEEKEAIVNGFTDGLQSDGPSELLQRRFQAVYDMLNQKAEDFAVIQRTEKDAANQAFFATLDADPDVQSDATGLYWEVIEPGEDPMPSIPGVVTVHYTGTLIDGTQFDSSRDRGEPAQFSMSGVVPGFSAGLTKVGVGGKVKIYIPSELGYGDNPRPGSPIQPGDVIIFDCEVIAFESTGSQ